MPEPSYDPMDRRPIQSRNTRWADAATKTLVRFGVSPNAISMFGMFAAITAGASFALTNYSAGPFERMLWIGGGLLCQIRLLCNLFDGMVAVKLNIASRKGELYNEVPDRVSDSAVFIGLGYSLTGDIALGFSAALISVFVAYVRAMAKSIGAPNDFCGPMAKPQRMALATIVAAYLAIAPDAWRLPWGEVRIVLIVVVVGGIATALRRLARTSQHLGKMGQ